MSENISSAIQHFTVATIFLQDCNIGVSGLAAVQKSAALAQRGQSDEACQVLHST